MRKFLIMAAFAVLGLGIACNPKSEGDAGANNDNPFFQEKWSTPFEVPPFDLIKVEHFKPALDEGIKQHSEEIKAIAENKEAPNFKNTIEAMDYSGSFLMRVNLVLDNWTSANISKELQDLAAEYAPILSKHYDEISMNEKLFARVKAVWENKDKENLNPEQARLLERVYKNFARNGAELNAEDKEKLKAINEKLAVLTLKFGDNVLAETNKYKLVISKKEDLAGLPDGLIAAAAETAEETGDKGKWVFTLHNPSIMPFLQYADNRELRKEIWTAYMMRGNHGDEFDNNKVIKDILDLKLQKAKLLGFQSSAHYILDDVMAKNPENVFNLLHKLWTPALKVAKKELEEMQAYVKKSGQDFKVEAWDWRYYANKVKEEKFSLNENDLKPYFELNNVRDGLFYTVNKLWGINFKKIDNMPKFNNDMEYYDLTDKDGKHIAVVSFDYHPRASKRGGAWMSNYSIQYIKDGKDHRPYIPLTMNFTKATKDLPALLTLDEVETLFHEFGHAVHGFLSQCTYPTLSGTNVARDFVEFPSQVLEGWATEPEVLKVYAKHYKTGEIIPMELVDKLKASERFGQGFATTEYLAASLLDMHFHILTDVSTLDPQKLEKDAMSKLGLIGEIIPRYRSTYFNHIFGGGYSAGYYGYIWSEVLDADTYAYFTEKGIFNQELSESFRANILSRGGTVDESTMYKNFRGRAATPDALIKRRGLN